VRDPPNDVANLIKNRNAADRRLFLGTAGFRDQCRLPDEDTSLPAGVVDTYAHLPIEVAKTEARI
jgi:hypothetical protein